MPRGYHLGQGRIPMGYSSSDHSTMGVNSGDDNEEHEVEEVNAEDDVDCDLADMLDSLLKEGADDSIVQLLANTRLEMSPMDLVAALLDGPRPNIQPTFDEFPPLPANILDTLRRGVGRVFPTKFVTPPGFLTGTTDAFPGRKSDGRITRQVDLHALGKISLANRAYQIHFGQ